METNSRENLVAYLILIAIGVGIYLSIEYIFTGLVILSGYINL